LNIEGRSKEEVKKKRVQTDIFSKRPSNFFSNDILKIYRVRIYICSSHFSYDNIHSLFDGTLIKYLAKNPKGRGLRSSNHQFFFHELCAEIHTPTKFENELKS